MTALFKRELRALFSGWGGWGFLALATGAAGIAVFTVNILGGAPSFAENTLYLALAMALGSGLCCMRAFPGERASNTERLLYTLPLRTRDIVLGKLLSRLIPVLLSGVLLALYPLGLSLAFPQTSLSLGLSSVAAVTALGMLLMSAALFCSACSRTAAGAFASFALLTLASWAAPYAAMRAEALTVVSPLMIALMTALVVLLVYILCSDWLVSFIAAALAEAPVLLLHLRGEDARVLEAFNALLKRLSVFEPLSAFVNGIFDVGTIAGYLTVAALFACLTGLAIAARRRGERRAL